MANTVTFTDVEALLVGHLAVAEHVGTNVPNPRPDAFYRVERVGGPRVGMVLELALVVLEAWAVEEVAAWGLMARGRTAMEALAGTTPVTGCPIYSIEENTGPVNLPDPLSTHKRYTITFEISIRGATT